MNMLTLTDSYKLSHWKQYPPGTTSVYSYFESRKGARFGKTVFFGLQYLLKTYLEGTVVDQQAIDEAEKLCDAHVAPGIFNRAGWQHILDKHKGRLPVRIRAVPEGTPIPTSNALMTLENTDPKCFWLTNYLETLLVQVWYPSTVATQSRAMKKIIARFLEETGGNLEGLGFKLHDFGFRGSTSVESAGLGGAAHLVNFLGTDTIRGVEMVRDYYGTGDPVAGFSIPAAEHSTITAWGKDNELAAMKNMLDQFDKGLVAVVSDSWDVYHAAKEYWGGALKEQVLARDGILVVRPDSGDPVEVVPKLMQILADTLGAEKNEKGFLMLNPKVRMIQGDGITVDSIVGILQAVKKAGFSTDNLAFGSGGGLLQKLDRDTQRFAFKCCSVTVNGEERDVYKDPITDPGKVSKKGRLSLYRLPNGQYRTFSDEITEGAVEVLETVFEDGKIVKEYSFDQVRENAAI